MRKGKLIACRRWRIGPSWGECVRGDPSSWASSLALHDRATTSRREFSD